MKSPAFSIVPFMVLFFAGCSSQPVVTPDWVAGDSSQYSGAQYLLGRGQAATQEEAKDRARADLSKIFQVTVEAESEDVQKFRAGGSEPLQYESQSIRRINTRTAQIIHGIQIAELWQDKSTLNFHALAVLPRLQTAASLRQQINALDEATGNHIEQSRKSSDLFLKITAASKAADSQHERDLLQKSLQVVDVTGRGVDAKWNAAKLKSDLEALLRRVKIAPQVEPGSAPGFYEVVAGALAKAGFMVDTGENPDFILWSRLELADLGFQDGWFWKRGILEVTLSEKGTKRIRGTMRWNVKSNAPDRESAPKRALNQADLILKQELRAAIIDMAGSR